MKINNIFFAIIAIGLMSSCTKVIEIDLNSAEPRLVVEASISNQPFEPQVNLSLTMDYYNPEVPTQVSGAIVTLMNDENESEILEETSEGIYTAKSIKGECGLTYTLHIEYNEVLYEASAFLPPLVKLDTVILTTMEEFGRANFDSVGGYLVNVEFQDPSDQENFYRINCTKINRDTSGMPQRGSSSYLVTSDALSNGAKISSIVNHDQLFQPGDTVLIELLSIDENVFSYYDQMSESSGMASMLGGSSPANPDNNISNGAMGCFTAKAIDKQVVVVQEK